MKISMKLVYQYIAIFFNFSTTSSHLHPLQVENCDSNSRLVVDEDDYGKFRIERVKLRYYLQSIGPVRVYCLQAVDRPFSSKVTTHTSSLIFCLGALPCYHINLTRSKTSAILDKMTTLV